MTSEPARSGKTSPGDRFVDEPEEYTVESKIGSGGMGTVLSARGSRLARPVALKVVTVDREDVRLRFEREANVTARLQHPAIVPVYGAGLRDGRPFYAMKHVTGEPLDRVIAAATTREVRIALLPKVIAVTDAIAYAHSERVIHRDLKPANILVGDFGETVVIDWGLAKDLRAAGAVDADADADALSPYRAASGQTAHGKVMGTPAYMPREQARGEPVDERADVYALGAILYHVLAGVPPYRSQDDDSVPWETMLARVIAGPPQALATIAPNLPPDLVAIVSRAMARMPADRYATAKELANDLERFQTGQLVGAHSYTPWQLVRRWLRRHRGPVAVAAIATIVLAGVAVASVKRIVNEQARTKQVRGEAEDLLGYMLGDLRGKLEPLGRLDFLDDIGHRAVAYYVAQGDDLSDEQLRKRALAQRTLGDVLVARGEVDEAKALYASSLEAAEELASRSPEDRARLEDLHIARWKVTDVLLARGDNAALLIAAKEMQQADSELARRHPEELEWAWYAAESDERVALALRPHDPKSALAQFRAEAANLDGLVGRADAATVSLVGPRGPIASPGIELRRDVAVAHGHVADTLWRLGDSASALAEDRVLERGYEALAAADPVNADRQDDLALGHGYLAWGLKHAGQLDQALVEARAALALRQTLADNDPTNAVRRFNLSDAHSVLSDFLSAHGDNDQALAEARAAVAIIDVLTTIDSSNAAWQSERGIEHEQVGNLLSDRGELATAEAEFRIDVQVQEQLVARATGDDMYRQNLSVAHERLGGIASRKGDHAGAIAEFRAEVELSRQTLAHDPDSRDAFRGLGIEHGMIGEQFLGQGDAKAALVEFQAYLAQATAFVAKDPQDFEAQLDVTSAEQAIGYALIAQGDDQGALAHLRTAAAELGTMHAANPGDARSQPILARVHQKIAEVLDRAGDGSGALAEHRLVLQVDQQLATADPKSTAVADALTIAHIGVGTDLQALGDLSGASAEYRAALATCDGGRITTDVPVIDACPTVHLALARLLAQQKRFDDARAEYDAVARAVVPVTAAKPDDRSASGVVAAVHEGLAEIDVAEGNPAAAAVELVEAKATASALDPFGRERIANKLVAALLANHQVAKAEQVARDAVATLQAVPARPDDVTYLNWLAQAYEDHGDAQMAGGKPRDAVTDYASALSTTEAIAKLAPGPEAWANVAEDAERRGDAREATSEHAGALEDYRAAQASLDRALDQRPSDPVLRARAATLANKLAPSRR